MKQRHRYRLRYTPSVEKCIIQEIDPLFLKDKALHNQPRTDVPGLLNTCKILVSKTLPFIHIPPLWKWSLHTVEYFAPDSDHYWECVNKPWTCPLTPTENDNNTLVKHYWNPSRTSFKHLYWFKGQLCPLIHFTERGTDFRWQISISESILSSVVIGQHTSQARIGELNIQSKQPQREVCYLFLVVLRCSDHGLRESVL